MFAFDDEMLNLANQLTLTKVALKPFDHDILAGILVCSSRLWNQGARGISFAEIDGDLQPPRPSHFDRALFGVLPVRPWVYVRTQMARQSAETISPENARAGRLPLRAIVVLRVYSLAAYA
jgi:hypothetical protein